MRITYTADLRYLAQLRELEVSLPLTNEVFTMDKMAELHRVFDEKHNTLYGYSLPDMPLELICLRVRAEGITDKPDFKETDLLSKDVSIALKTHRKIYYDEEFISVPVYDGNKMGYGHEILGPAVIEEPTTTILITPDFQLTCDKYNSYLIYSKNMNIDQVIDGLRK